jgi:hypothetical protein
MFMEEEPTVSLSDERQMYISWIKLRPIHCGAVVKKPWRQRATMKVVLFGERVANNVMKRDMNMDHQRTGIRPKRCAKGTEITPPTPSIYISGSKVMTYEDIAG